MNFKVTDVERFFCAVLAAPLIGFSLAGVVGPLPGWIGLAILLSALRRDLFDLKQNMGDSERLFRFLLALALIGFSLSGRVGSMVGWAGLEVMATALFGWSPLYAVVGYTARRQDAR